MLTKATYREKLRDPRWQKMRLHALERANWKCQKCFSADKELHVHHTIYAASGDPWDVPPETLWAYCPECHRSADDLRRRLTKTIGTVSPWKQELWIEQIESSVNGTWWVDRLERFFCVIRLGSVVDEACFATILFDGFVFDRRVGFPTLIDQPIAGTSIYFQYNSDECWPHAKPAYLGHWGDRCSLDEVVLLCDALGLCEPVVFLRGADSDYVASCVSDGIAGICGVTPRITRARDEYRQSLGEVVISLSQEVGFIEHPSLCNYQQLAGV